MSDPSDYNTYNFAKLRHIGPSTAEISEMLATLGYQSLDALIDDTLPTNIRQSAPLDIGDALSEDEALTHMREVADQNEVRTSLIGQGYYGTITPTPILRNILENPAWYTAYTPYQPEISQGRLEALLNYQTMMSELTGLAIANASMLDEATAASEAMAMSRRSAKSKANIYFIDHDCHPQNIAVLKTRAEVLGVEVVIGDPNAFDAEKYFGAIFQYPGSSGEIKDVSTQIAALHEHKAIGTVIADPLALCLLKTPADMGADIAIGSTQRFGVPLGYGGPHAAYMCCTDALKRAMPGRIIGVSIDSKGQPALRLALQTREQHIRRDKANSNLCTAQALLAVIASMYAVYHGPRGLQQIAQRVHKKTSQLAQSLGKAGFEIINQTYFDTITLAVGQRQSALMAAALKAGFNLRAVGEDRIGISLDETTTDAKLSLLIKALGGELDNTAEAQIPTNLQREAPPLTHEIFEQNRAEAQITRYMRRLADRDLALDRAMIPLGSCTMKLNATTEMIPVTWPEFADLHPYAPKDQAKGYQIMMDDLSKKLCAITGYDDFSLQPNSGAQGEFAGLLTIRNFHLANGDAHRTTCLIPISAHGTNPATASMVGWKVVPVKSDENGNIDIEDFRSKAAEHADTLAATMITYPSTHGVFEADVTKICDITHEFGGQVYIDGANMNAMVGLSRPGDLGGDVSHLNLHKTFCIPHGGGGPGMGPIGVKSHLIPHLPSDPNEATGNGPVSAAAFGSASILPVSWAYILLCGSEGLTQATKVAILSANYIAKRLEGAYNILFTGQSGRIAHECILDTRPFANRAGISVDDIAKRLMDCGFHAPTMSWPVAGTLMVEPTESEPKAELDRFCDAMLGIAAEVKAIQEGTLDPENNPLKNAPHTVADLIEDWDRPYSREVAIYPAGAHRADKYFPAVNRVDNAHGDRNLVCTCPPMEDYS